MACSAVILRLAPVFTPRAARSLVRSRALSTPSYGLSDEVAAAAIKRDVDIRTHHLALNTDVPAASLAPGSDAVNADDVRRKRLVYR